MSIYKRSLKIHISAVREVNQFAISKAQERIAWKYTSNHWMKAHKCQICDYTRL